jgi:hypothetical protein
MEGNVCKSTTNDISIEIKKEFGRIKGKLHEKSKNMT